MSECILFVTWDGPQIRYLESLFVPIFKRLQDHDIETSILQFGWGDGSQADAACKRAGIAYRRVNVLRGFGTAGAAASALAGGLEVRRAVKDWKPTIVMPRSLLAGLAVLAAGKRKVPPMLFDADGLAADERVEAGNISRGSAVYRALVGIEGALIRRSCHALVRTQGAAEILVGRAGVDRSHFTVVANGRDEQLFKPGESADRSRVRGKLGVADDEVLLVYAGSAGPQYRLDDAARLVAAVRETLPSVRLLVLSGDCEAARCALGDEAGRAIFRSVRPEEVPAFLSAADAGLALRSESLAMRAVAPIKIGEYLLCGLPVIGTLGIGDTSPAQDAGVMIDADAPPGEIANWLADRMRESEATVRLAREIGTSNFSLDRSVANYRAAIVACRERR